MPEESGGERTLPASPLKRQRARERGTVAKSQDLVAAGSMLFGLLTLWFFGSTMFAHMVEAMRYFLAHASDIDITTTTAPYTAIQSLLYFGGIMAPVFILLTVAGLAMNYAQVGFLFAPEAIAPKFERLNPFEGFRKFFSLRAFVELIKSVLKLAIISYVVYITVRGRWENLFLLSHMSPVGVVYGVGEITALLWFRIMLVMVAIGLLDYLFQRWQYEQDLRMTVQEAREELKELEGDPRIRQRVRQIQRQMAMQRMMAEVPKADVVITNPTTYAVALRYAMDSMDAPVVVAKGARILADRIRRIATEHDVPIVEKPELARTLYRTVEVSHAIPESLYRAVAEILSFVYAIDQREEKKRERSEFLTGSMGRLQEEVPRTRPKAASYARLRA
ncbi:MAG TPA: flagellar biosynthesis protein FlhB [Candidatus Hydrogenedentes bacterium]|nr:flagellar biosynthesis protein FlhB [Candidatus Hydrogenedentota bacterium]HOL76742.1 flagellar biosynthesis protein FlhB [Candidatus Hydrogenedentota bacterium]HPO85297.1 flagellar biosynthesis protein FlhB [Candidatus Hydrogenedentota bacterium]